MTTKSFRRVRFLPAGCLAALATAAFAQTNELPPGVVLRYTFDRAESGGAVVDVSENNHTGRATAARWTSQGRDRGGMDFGPGLSFIMVTNAPALNPKQLSIALWVRSTFAHPAGQTVIDKRANQGYGMTLGGGPTNGPHHGRLIFTVNGKSCMGDTNIVDGAFYHAVAIADGKTLRMYVDGQLQKQVVPLEAEIASNPSHLFIGATRSSGDTNAPALPLEGSIDSLTIFNRALTPAEVTNVWVFGIGKFTESQVRSRRNQIQDLMDRRLLTQEFYNRKMKELEILPIP